MKGFGVNVVPCEIKIQNSVLDVGAEKPFSVLHITDAHINITESSEPNEAKDYFEKALAYARESNLPIICTGDNFHCFSDANFRYAIKIPWSENDVVIPGNHDFCYLPENAGLGDMSRCGEFSEKWHAWYKQNMCFDSKIINGVNFVSLMNLYYRISDEQVRLLRGEVERGYPVVLCMHVPLFRAEDVDARLRRGHPEGGMLAPPREFIKRYAPKYAEEQGADKSTLCAVEYIANEPRIAAVVAGHQHEDFDGFADCGKRQVLTASVGREGIARLIEII